MTEFPPDAPYHAHIYFRPDQRQAAEALRARLVEMQTSGAAPDLLFVGSLREGKVGPHPQSQFEIHFPKRALDGLLPTLETTGLRLLVHPLTLDDVADHTTLGRWIGEPLELDLTTLDPPGINQGIPRYGKTDF